MQEERNCLSTYETAGGAGVGVEKEKTSRGSESCASANIH